jgi:hypothetical protein
MTTAEQNFALDDNRTCGGKKGEKSDGKKKKKTH